jgi:hypothetical protein
LIAITKSADLHKENMMTFFDYLFNTIQTKANNPTDTEFWLPKVLADIDNPNNPPGGKLLPPRDLSLDIGNIEGENGNNIIELITAQSEIASHGTKLYSRYKPDPWPKISISDAQISGLNNVFLYPDPNTASSDNGYQSTIRLKFDQYPASSASNLNASVELKNLSFSGSYEFTLTMEQTELDGTIPQPYIIKGLGTFTTTISNASLNIGIELAVKGIATQRHQTIQINNLSLLGELPTTEPLVSTSIDTMDAYPKFIRATWKDMANQVLNAPSTIAVLLQKVEQELNDPDTLGQLSATMTTQLNGVIDSLFGKLSNQLPDDQGQNVPNPVDLYFFDRIRMAMVNATSDFYLPHILKQAKNPSLNPLVREQIDFPPFSPSSGIEVTIKLQALTVNGLADIVIEQAGDTPKIFLNQGIVTFHAQKPQATKDALTITTNITVTIAGEPIGPLPIGLTIKDMSFKGEFGAVADDGELKVNFKNVAMDIAATPQNIVFDLSKINSTLFKPEIALFLQEPKNLKAIVKGLNDQLNTPKMLKELGSAASSAANNAISNL